MENTDLQEDGEALRKTLERIEFLVRQGLLKDTEATIKKQHILDTFMLAPMIERQQLLRSEDPAIPTAIDPARGAVDLVGGININNSIPVCGTIAPSPLASSTTSSAPFTSNISSPMAAASTSAASYTAAAAAAADIAAMFHKSGGISVFGDDGMAARTSPVGVSQSRNPEARQPKQPSTAEVLPAQHEIDTAIQALDTLLVADTVIGIDSSDSKNAASTRSPSSNIRGSLPQHTPLPFNSSRSTVCASDLQQSPKLKSGGVPLARIQECEEEGCHLLPVNSSGEGGGGARVCAQHHSVGLLNTRLPHATAVTNKTMLVNIQASLSPQQRSPHNIPSPRTSQDAADALTLNPWKEFRPIIPELPLVARSVVESQAVAIIKFPSVSPGIFPLAPLTLAISDITSGNVTSSDASVGECAPDTIGSLSAAVPLGQSMVQMLGVEAELKPPTVPDPAEMKRGTCEWQDCTKEPHYAPQGKRARTCFAHKKEEWVHVSRRRCDMDGCPRGAYFSLQESAAIFCSMHRTPAMLDIVNLRRYKCQTEGCRRQAYYNVVPPTSCRNRPKFCSTHKLPDMLNVRHRLCESEGCGTTPTYSLPGDRPRFCASHKAKGMVDTKSKTCQGVDADESSCHKCRLYGLPEGKATYCFAHKKEGMVNIRQARKRKSRS